MRAAEWQDDRQFSSGSATASSHSVVIKMYSYFYLLQVDGFKKLLVLSILTRLRVVEIFSTCLRTCTFVLIDSSGMDPYSVFAHLGVVKGSIVCLPVFVCLPLFAPVSPCLHTTECHHLLSHTTYCPQQPIRAALRHSL
jgi:hypothetical protein